MIPSWLLRSQRAALLLTVFLFSAGYATIGLVFILLTVIAEAILTRKPPWTRSPVDALLLSFVVIFLISGFASAYRTMAVGSAVLAALTIYLAFGSFYRHLQRDKDFLKPFLWTWVGGGTGAAVWAILLHRLYEKPAFTPALGQNAVGTTLLVALVLGLGLFLATNTVRRYLVGMGCALAAIGLLFTSTRGAWVGAGFGVMSFFLLLDLRSAWRALLLVVLISVAGIVVAGPERASLFHRALSIISLSSNQSRLALARSALAIFEDHPLIGTGLNTFSFVYPAYQLPGDPNPPSQPFAHNIFLNMAAEGGVLGLASFTALIIYASILGWRWYAQSAPTWNTPISAAILSALLGMMVNQLFDGTIISVHLGTGLWFLIAILAAFRPSQRPSSATSDFP